MRTLSSWSTLIGIGWALAACGPPPAGTDAGRSDAVATDSTVVDDAPAGIDVPSDGPIPTGAPCRIGATCVAGSRCVQTGSDSTMRTCVADGTQNGQCLGAEPRCQSGLTCTTNSTFGYCRTTVMVGGSCDPLRRANACATGSTCAAAPMATTGTCRADGAMDGHCRAADPRCDPSLTCTTSSTLGYCRTTVALGGACDPTALRNACATGSNCVASAADRTMGTCVAAGAVNGRCRTTTPTCDASLTCYLGYCRTTVAAGGACDPTGALNACAAGSRCARSATDPAMGTCRADGTANGRCRTTEPRCDAGLACSLGLCVPSVAVGAACDPSGRTSICATNSSCVVSTANASMGTCVAYGGAGARCRATEPRCDTPLQCSGTTSGTCRTVVAVGGACDPSGDRTTCATGSSCVPAVGSTTMGTCTADGGAGTRCRTTEPRCEPTLTCSGATSGTCRRSAAAGAACDPLGVQTVCEAGSVCARTTATAATCVAAAMETEPNDSPAAAQTAVTASAVFTGDVMPGTDVDCYGVTLPAGASLLLETNNGAGGCPAAADTIVRLYNPAGMLITEDDDSGPNLCSFVNGTTAGPAHALPAGTYAVCVASYDSTRAIADYYLDIAIIR